MGPPKRQVGTICQTEFEATGNPKYTHAQKISLGEGD